MAIVTLTDETFDQTVKHGIVLLDFWASWCGPCRAFAPKPRPAKAEVA